MVQDMCAAENGREQVQIQEMEAKLVQRARPDERTKDSLGLSRIKFFQEPRDRVECQDPSRHNSGQQPEEDVRGQR